MNTDEITDFGDESIIRYKNNLFPFILILGYYLKMNIIPPSTFNFLSVLFRGLLLLACELIRRRAWLLTKFPGGLVLNFLSVLLRGLLLLACELIRRRADSVETSFRWLYPIQKPGFSG